MKPGRRILGAALAPCVHTAGLHSFLRLARACGHETECLGAAVSMAALVEAALEYAPDLLALSYRLSPATAGAVFTELQEVLAEAGLAALPLVFGGTPPVAAVARESGLFQAVFDGTEGQDEVLAYLKGGRRGGTGTSHPQTLLARIAAAAPYPILRHHFGLPSLTETVSGAGEIARAGVLDVISLGPDQNAQESFFRPEEMVLARDGAGGAPIRAEADLRAIYEAARCGNHPLLRIYAGTRDLLAWAELAQRSINNAWAAIPLFWYSQLDGRSQRPLAAAIAENQAAMAWHAERGLPVEVNDPHQWSLREAPDVVAAADAYLAAYNAKAKGVKTYIAQFMWNTPPALTPAMDLAKMLAMLDLLRTLEAPDFTVLRECRAGLACFVPEPATAKGQLAASTMLSLALKPHILHVVAFCEADHAATPAEIIESCRIVRGVLKQSWFGAPDPALDPAVQARRQELVEEACLLLQAIRSLGSGSGDPLTDAEVLARAVRTGLLDAPLLAGGPWGLGKIRTAVIDGACRAVDAKEKALCEEERLRGLVV